MNIFNFCGSGSGGSGGTSVLIQYQKTVDSSHNTQMIVADYPYQVISQVEVLAPRMKAITLVGNKDSSTVYNIVDEGDVAAGYVGIEQVTVPVVTAAIDTNITPENIKSGISIIGVTGVYNQDFEYTTLYNRLVTI